ncbi:MAG: putative transcriptional regulator [bacterium]|nr:putative transcriptional regulator [bacterium]
MDIKTYLQKHGLSQDEFGKRLRNPVSQGLVWQWIEGRTNITIDRAREIVEASEGEITPHDLMPNVFPKGFEFPLAPPAKPAPKKAAA